MLYTSKDRIFHVEFKFKQKSIGSLLNKTEKAFSPKLPELPLKMTINDNTDIKYNSKKKTLWQQF